MKFPTGGEAENLVDEAENLVFCVARNPRSGGTGEIPVPTVRQSDC